MTSGFEGGKYNGERINVPRETRDEAKLLVLPSLQRYSEAHNSYLEKYAQNLPHPDANLGVVTVVPAYKELQNDNFWRLLRSLVAQRETTEAHEILYVVNNRPDDTSSSSSAFAENQKTLQILRTLETLRSEETVPENQLNDVAKNLEFTDWEKEVFASALREKVRILGIDASSDDKAINPIFNARGRARDIGGHIAHERLRLAGREANGMIDFIDADCYLSPTYFREIEKRDPKKTLLLKRLVAYTPDIYSTQESGDDYRDVANTLRYLRDAPFEGRTRYLIGFHKDDDKGHGPIVMTNPGNFAKVGGYPHWLAGYDFGSKEYKAAEQLFLKMGPTKTQQFALCREDSEDYNFKDNLVEAVEDNDVDRSGATVFVSHRIREGNVDGQTLRDSLYKLPSESGEQALASLSKWPDDMKSVINLVFENNQKLEGNEEYRRLRAQAWHRENIQRKASIQQLQKLIPIVLDSADLSKETRLSDRERDYLLANQSLIHLVKKISRLTTNMDPYKGLDDSARVMQFLEKYLPDNFIEPPATEPNYAEAYEKFKKTGELSALRDFVHIPMAVHAFNRPKVEKAWSTMIRDPHTGQMMPYDPFSDTESLSLEEN